MTAQQKFSSLVEFIRNYDDVAVAFSGGTNSSLLLCAASEACGKETLALTANTAFLTQEELYRVHEVLDDYKMRDARVPVYVLEDREIAANGQERCALCRAMITQTLRRAAKGMGCGVLLNAGLKESQSCGCIDGEASGAVPVASPFVELGFTKADVIEMLHAVGRAYYIRAPQVCLADRFVQGEPLSVEKLDFLEQAEQFAKRYTHRGVLIECANWDILVRTKEALTEGAHKEIQKKFQENGAKAVAFRVDISETDGI